MVQQSHCWAYTLRKPELKETCVQVFDRTSSVPAIPRSRMGGPYGSISSVQLLSHVRFFATPWTTECQASLSHHQLPELAQTHVHRVSDAIQPSRPLLLLPLILPSIRVFSNESVLHIKWPKYWNFSFSISPSNEYSGLISFRIDWFGLLAVQGTLKSLLQHHS